VAGLLEGLERDGRALLGRAGVAERDVHVERAADMRLIGQAHEITVELPGEAPRAGDEARLTEAFEGALASVVRRARRSGLEAPR